MAVGVKVVNRPGGLAQQVYLPAIAEGLGVTFRHFVKNFFGNVAGQRKRPTSRPSSTPKRRRPTRAPPRPAPADAARGRPGPLRRLHDVPDRVPRPLHHHRRRKRRPTARIEKRPEIFEIDELRCVVCGLCAEACPCDAIRMDTLEHAKPTYRRVDAILDKEELMSRGIRVVAVQGGVGAFWREKVASAPQTPPSR